MKMLLIMASLLAVSFAAVANSMSGTAPTTAPSSSNMNSAPTGAGTTDAAPLPSQQSMETDDVDLKKTDTVTPSTAPNQQRMEDVDLEEEDEDIMYDDSRIDDIEEEEDVE